MSPEHEKVVEEALKLPEEGRAALAGILLESLEHPDEHAEQAWRDEVRRRLKSLRDGGTSTIPLDEVMQRLVD